MPWARLVLGALALVACSGSTLAGSADAGSVLPGRDSAAADGASGAGAGGEAAGGAGGGIGGGGNGGGGLGANGGTGYGGTGYGGTGYGGTGGGPSGGTGGIDCALVDYCNGDTLEVVDHEAPPCDPTPIDCPAGCVDNGGYLEAVCAVECGGVVCPVPPAMSYFSWRPCCTAQGQCGFSNAGSGCYRFDYPGVADPDCPAEPGDTGCCLPGNVCGVMWSPSATLGCMDAAYYADVPPTDCDGNPLATDAGSDASPDASPADAAAE